ncbi:MAG: tetratricopeptide repeat protein [candidate division Zixibacteria bacterium]|nr:tetratricopeptide repeat protein [candidate division Zixibacteria bacterium]MDH3938744.1 tetratricopeptide repeat protein [candidate division Zixibacteria bacterium]MDH4033318.1 tetratricopeptide repeat protein [candidate division Zixibacteria bacterium]
MRVLDLYITPRNWRLSVLATALIIVFGATVAYSADDLKPNIVEALDAADTVKAMELLEAEIGLDPGYHMNYNQLGKIYYERRQFGPARDNFQLAVQKKKKHWESLYLLGRCQLELGEIDEAEKTMSDGRKRARKFDVAQFDNGFGLVMMARERFSDADLAFRAALILDSSNAEYHLHLGDANFYQGIPSLAISEYELALQVDTASLEVYYHWAEACLEMRDYTCAIDKLKVVLQKDSTHAPAWMRAGGIYFKAAMSISTRDERKARFMEAIGAYQRYLELSEVKPDTANVRVYFEIAMGYVNVGGAEQAVKYFEDVLSIPYVPRDIYFQYGKALWGVQDFVKSGEALQKHLTWLEDPDNAEATRIKPVELYQYLGDAYYYRKDKDFYSAIKYYSLSLDERPDQKRLLYNVAVSYHNEKQYAQALDYYQRRIDMGIDTSKNAGIYKNAGYCALNIANQDGSDDEESLEEEDMEEPVDSGIDPNLNYYEVAVGYMEQYLAIKPEEVKTILLVANTYLYQLSDCENGVKYFKRLLEVEPNNCDAKKALGYAYFGGVCTKNYSKALTHLLSAQQCLAATDGACNDVDLIVWIAQCYHTRAAENSSDKAASSDDFQKANQWYTKCLNCEPGNQVCKQGRDDTSFEF